MDCLASARYRSMTCLRLLTGLGVSALSLRSWVFRGKGSGIFSGADFFLRRKNAEDFFVTVGGVALMVEALELAGCFWTCFGRRATGLCKLSYSRPSGLSPSNNPGALCCDMSDGPRIEVEDAAFFPEPNMRRKNPLLSLNVAVVLLSMNVDLRPGELICIGSGGKASRLVQESVE